MSAWELQQPIDTLPPPRSLTLLCMQAHAEVAKAASFEAGTKALASLQAATAADQAPAFGGLALLHADLLMRMGRCGSQLPLHSHQADMIQAIISSCQAAYMCSVTHAEHGLLCLTMSPYTFRLQQGPAVSSCICVQNTMCACKL